MDKARQGRQFVHRAQIAQPWCKAQTPPLKLVTETWEKPAADIKEARVA